jgi:phospholipid transport system substrate-binding protein
MRSLISSLFSVGVLLVPVVARAQSPAAAAVAPAPSPKAEVEAVISEVVRIAQALPGDQNTTKRRAELREVINPRFDFEEMAKRSLGAEWRNCTPDQQKDFVDVFSGLLSRTYLSRIETVKPGMVTIDSEKLDGAKAVVRTTVNHKGDEFPIEYKLLNEAGTWRVYDVVIENIGLVANYRNEFAGIIRKEKFDGLMSRLRAKSEV